MPPQHRTESTQQRETAPHERLGTALQRRPLWLGEDEDGLPNADGTQHKLRERDIVQRGHFADEDVI